MRTFVFSTLLSLVLGGWAVAQQEPQTDQDQQEQPGQNQAPPRSAPATEAGESSSRDTRVDISPPKDDAKNHPNSGVVETNPEDEPEGDVQEMHPWNPYRAMKDDEVGDYYFKRKSYKAALARYQDALIWKEKDAVANFRMAQCYEKLDQPDQAIPHYEEYLKILPDGPYAKEARKALQKLKRSEAKNETSQKTESKP
ncbi:MAG: tetratricopeptide repeat protein [Terriglobales bacterium]